MPTKEKNKSKTYIMLGAIVIIIAAGVGSQFCITGRIYQQKINFLKEKNWKLNSTLNWSDWEKRQEFIRFIYKSKVNVERTEVKDWDEFYTMMRAARKLPEGEGGIVGPIYVFREDNVIWFDILTLKGTQGRGTHMTYYIYPDA